MDSNNGRPGKYYISDTVFQLIFNLICAWGEWSVSRSGRFIPGEFDRTYTMKNGR